MRALLFLALAGVALGGCKKKETETVAAAPAPVDPAKTIVVNIDGDHAFKTVTAHCKTHDDAPKGNIKGKSATVTGLVGDCTLQFNPGAVSYGPVQGGSTLNCIVQADDTVSCKGG